MALRSSSRSCAWLHSLTKFDHSKHTADGKRVRWRERMHEGSSVYAPPIFPVGPMRALKDAELLSPIPEEDEESERDAVLPMPDRVHAQQADGKAAELRDVPGAILRVLDRARGGSCGGMATDGKTEATAHQLCVTMDGAGITHDENGVRVALFPGSVELMNQSSNQILDLVFYKAGGMAEDYYVLLARCASVRTQLCEIYKAGGTFREASGSAPREFVHVKFFLSDCRQIWLLPLAGEKEYEL